MGSTPKYKYEYDPTTNELTKITISIDDSVIETTDMTVHYSYAEKNFRSNLCALQQTCTRVVTQKQVSRPEGGLDTWTYSYPDLNAQQHIVTVVDPKQNKRSVEFQGYTDDLNVWQVGNLLSDETSQFDSGNYTSIKKVDFAYIANTVSSSPIDLETCGQIGIKVPVMTSKVVTYPQTSQQAVLVQREMDFSRFEFS